MRIVRSHYKLVFSQILLFSFCGQLELLHPISGLYIDELIAGIRFDSFVAFILIIAIANFLENRPALSPVLGIHKPGTTDGPSNQQSYIPKIFTSKYAYYCNIDCAYYIDQINRDSNAVVNFWFPTFSTSFAGCKQSSPVWSCFAQINYFALLSYCWSLSIFARSS